MNDELMESLLYENEGTSLDFKRDQYPFAGEKDDVKSELLKDILAFANSWRRTTAYILIGVDEVKGGRSIVNGVSSHLNDSDLQQFVNTKTNRRIDFKYEAFPFEGKQVGIIAIPQQKRPFLVTKDYGKVKKQEVYSRSNSSTYTALTDEVAQMASADVMDDWTQKQLEEDRRDREEQRKLQRELHAETYRPQVVCDFPIIYTIMYVCIKNYGNLPAKDIGVAIEGEVTLPRPVAGLLHPISLLAPNRELIYCFLGPQEFDYLPEQLTLNVSYSDLKGTRYEEKQRFDFAYFGRGTGAMGIDMGREENNPLVRAIKNLAEAISKRRHY